MEKLNHTEEPAQPLWTRDFTIITLGSVVSMFGNAMSGFAMSLLVLDYTGSSLFYAIYIAVFTLPQMIMPVFSGAVLDRFSRRRMIYTLDFVSAVMYGLAALLLGSGWFSFPCWQCFVLWRAVSIAFIRWPMKAFIHCSLQKAIMQKPILFRVYWRQ